MQLYSFEQQRHKAHQRLQKEGRLTYGARRDLLDLSKTSSKINKVEESIFLTLLEIKSADLVKNKWEKYGSEYFRYFPSSVLDAARQYINYESSNAKVIKKISNSMIAFTEFVNLYHSDPNFHSIILENDLPLDTKMYGQARTALLTINDAIVAISCHGMEFRYDKEDDWQPDPFESTAVDWAVKATDLSAKEFWAWYIDVAFPQALAEVPKYLKQGDG